MRRLICLAVLLATSLSGAAVSQVDNNALGEAIRAFSRGDTARGDELARGISDPIAHDLLAWTRLRRGGAEFEEYVDFLDRNPDWPGLTYLRRQGEPSISPGSDPATVLDYFIETPPQTGAGALAFARALQATGDRAAAEAEVIRAWTSLDMTATHERILFEAFGEVLTRDHHIARLDHLLWEGETELARGMYERVPGGWEPLAEARIALQARRNDVNERIARVPAELRNNPGLAHDRFIWRMAEGEWSSAAALMLEHSTSAEQLGRPARWGRRRADLARDVMREGRHQTCYDYASTHQVTADEDYLRFADLEWISGYCALQIGQPELAIRHFSRFREVVFSPISVGRAGYWLGRAFEAAGNQPAAMQAYALGAQNQSSFYGQLAQERGGLPIDTGFLGQDDYGTWHQASFTQLPVFHAALMLYEANQRNLAERFFTHITERLDEREAGLLGDLMLELGEPHFALMVAKRAAQSGHEIYRAYYPLADLEDVELPVSRALALSIARRESEFDPIVESGAGALGLMQVMPATGRASANDLGISFSLDRLRSDPAYNVLIGANYLDELLEDYSGNLVLVSVGYNAGPGRVQRWVDRFGDPRRVDDVIDWIEDVPFSETRNYIMRVLESIPIYEAQLTGQLPSIGLSARLVQ